MSFFDNVADYVEVERKAIEKGVKRNERIGPPERQQPAKRKRVHEDLAEVYQPIIEEPEIEMQVAPPQYDIAAYQAGVKRGSQGRMWAPSGSWLDRRTGQVMPNYKRQYSELEKASYKRGLRARRPYRRRRYKGKGKYSTVRGRGGFWSGLKRMAAPVVGAGLGLLQRKAISAISGMGDYEVKRNTLVHEGQDIASFGDMSKATIISHREYIADIEATGATAFSLDAFPINPGVPATFPWLSRIARNYDSYEFLGCIFQFKSTSSSSSSSEALALGSVILATNYNGEDPNYRDKLEMQNSQYASASKPSNDVIHAVECDPSVNMLGHMNVRTGGVPSNEDIRLYDHGKFQIAIEGVPSNASGTLGELWVSYQVALYKPLLGSGPLTDKWNLTTFVASIAVTNRFGQASGTAVAPDAGSSLLGSIDETSKYTFPATINRGKFMLMYHVTGTTSVAAADWSDPTLTNCSALEVVQNDGNHHAASSAVDQTGASVAAETYTCFVEVTGPSASITITNAALNVTGEATCTLIVSELTDHLA